MSIKIDVGNVQGNMQAPPEPTKFDFTTISSKIPNIGGVVTTLRSQIRPWSIFFQIQNFKTVANVQRLSNRLLRNLAHFQSNYAIISLVLMLYCLLTSPLILIVLAACVWINYKVRQIQTTITIFGRPLNSNQQCLAVSCASVPILYLAGAGAALFWVLGASAFFVSLHAVFYNIDAIVTEEEADGFALSETV